MAPLTTRRSRGRTPVPAGRALGLLLLGVFLFARFGDAFRLPFLNDDYLFLDQIAGKGFAELWGFSDAVVQGWHPWSREFHYWWLQRAFGPLEWPFHVTSLLLACGVLAAFWALARRLVGAPGAAIAVAGAATLPGWGVLLMWAGGAQDLWMLLLSLLALLAWRADRVGWAALAYGLALVSKETAAPLLLLFLAHDRWIGRRPWQESLVRMSPAIALLAAWSLAHPLLLGRLWSSLPTSVPLPPAVVAPWDAVLRSALAVFSVDQWPVPLGGWKAVWWDGLRGALLLLLFVELLVRPDSRPSDMLGGTRTARLRGALPFALAWWGCGVLPLLLPRLGWHTGYGQFAALGLWLVVGQMLARQTGTAMVLLGVIGFLGAGRAATAAQDSSETSSARRTGALVAKLRSSLLAAHPRLEPHSRLWFPPLGEDAGFLAAESRAVRVWYHDRTLQTGYANAYRPRAVGEQAGPDYFLRMDEAGRLFDAARGDTSATFVPARPSAVTGKGPGVDAEGSTGASAATGTGASTGSGAATSTGAATRAGVESVPGLDPRSTSDPRSLAAALMAGKDWRAASAEYRRLAIAFPDSSTYAFAAATAYLQAGDSAAGFQWLRESVRRPGASPEQTAAAKYLLGETAGKPARKRTGPKSDAVKRAREYSGLSRR